MPQDCDHLQTPPPLDTTHLMHPVALRGGVEASADAHDANSSASHSFIPSMTFAGPVPGMAFKMGELGCGYYPDTPQPVTAAEPTAAGRASRTPGAADPW